MWLLLFPPRNPPRTVQSPETLTGRSRLMTISKTLEETGKTHFTKSARWDSQHTRRWFIFLWSQRCKLCRVITLTSRSAQSCSYSCTLNEVKTVLNRISKNKSAALFPLLCSTLTAIILKFIQLFYESCYKTSSVSFRLKKWVSTHKKSIFVSTSR